MADANFQTGNRGVIAIDKVGNQVLFLDPNTYATTLTLDGFAPRVHEVSVSPDQTMAYVPIYGDGIHGKNPRPGHLVAVFDLEKRRHVGDFSTYPYLAPHGLRWGPRGELYCVCENSGAILEMDAKLGTIKNVIEVGSNKAHRIEVTPDGAKLYSENEEDTFGSVIDLTVGARIKKIPAPNGLAGIGMSPDGKTVVLVDAKLPEIIVVDTASDEVVRTIRLDGHDQAAQIARYSPDGRYLVVTSFDAPLATVFDATLGTQSLLHLGQGPMNMAFHSDGRTVVIANQNEGSVSICDLEKAEVLRTVPAGVGVEALSFY
ncbi:WD40 repeat domain-containing protein [uncultured Caballeronia sp.]|uniref:WD40 repeat domain-containing protein n=1 Tax=uncultured Caballeronia sp. TaxID=1827198 RepID=UPI001575F643